MYREAGNDGFRTSNRYLPNNWPTNSRCCVMSTQKNNTRNIDPEKITAERLNGYAALFGCIALVGAYATTGQIIPGFV